MGYVFEDFIESSNKLTQHSSLVCLYTEILKKLGFDSVVYSFLTDHRASYQKAGHGVISNYPEDWMNHYLANDYFATDPAVIYGQTTTRAFTWDFVLNDPLTIKKDKYILKEAEDAGLQDGVIIPLHSARGELAGVGLARTEKTEIADKNTLSLLQAITEQFHFCYCQIGSQLGRTLDVPKPQKKLTLKQKEVLELLAIDKTANEIAMLMNITENTVNYHIKEIYDRLETNSRILTVVKAIRLGLLSMDKLKI